MIRVGIADFKGRRALGILPTSFSVEDDTVLVSHIRGNPISYLLARPTFYIHGLTVLTDDHRLATRSMEALTSYTFGWGPAAPRLTRGALFQIESSNARMEAIANSLGGVEEEGSRIFRIDP